MNSDYERGETVDIKALITDYLDKYRKEYSFNVERKDLTVEYVKNTIEHTNLKPTATKEDIIKLCNEAKEYGFYGVCVNPYYVKLAKNTLKDSKIKIVTVCGFPLGATPKEVKAYETKKAIEDGADEIDMVINIGALKSKEYDTVYEDIKAVVEAAQGKVVKVIIEACYLTNEEKVIACVLSKAAGAHYVKTSTGFGTHGAKVSDVHLMRWVVGEKMGVKAAGGIRDFERAVLMLSAGADKIGTSSGAKIIGIR